MQVMNNDQFSQNEVLIGGATKTKGFKVSDDPMLMSMLSTGFYANPHRAMIQEVMFNAWDAHRMGKCQDTPIDIYINKNTGFLVRDYGPGIHDDDMEDVYCTYAASTKRDDEDQTGGFGLGSKSPWSYTESFTVTSHHKGVKTMYLMSRVSDDVQGKPGMTQLMSFKTDETGLSVAVPLNNGELQQTRRLVRDVLYLSGIKANIHYEDSEPELIESESVAPGQYIMDNRGGEHNDRKIYAVYGGVRYLIPEKEEYAQEFAFMNMISEIASLYIGFKPHSLSPLPNREGLNMSTNTKENIRSGMELCMEQFQSVFDPLAHAFFRARFDDYKKGGVQSHLAMFHALTSSAHSIFLEEFRKTMSPLVPFKTDATVWDIALRLMQKSMNTIIDVLGHERWMSILLQHFIRCYPEDKSLAFLIMKEKPKRMINRNHYSNEVQEVITDWIMPKQLSKLYEFEQQWLKDFPEDSGFARPKLRLNRDSDWEPMERHRNAPKGLHNRYHRPMKTYPPAKVTFTDPTKIWSSKQGEEVDQFFLSNIVVLAKTVSALKETNLHVNDHFSNDRRNYVHYMNHGNYGMIPAYVVHTRKGGYEKALEILTNLGFNVIEGAEPTKYNYVTDGKPRQIIKQYARINTASEDWQADEIDPDAEDYDEQSDGVPLTSPTHFLYVKKGDLGNYYYTSLKPSKNLVHCMRRMNPDIAMVNNQTQAEKLEKEGVKPFHELVINWYDAMGKKVYRFRNIVRVIKVLDDATISYEMIQHPVIQAAMGIAKVKEDDLSFWDEMSIINLIKDEDYYPLRPTAKQMKDLIQDTWKNDPQRDVLKKAIKATTLFSESSLSTRWRGLSTDEKDQFAGKLARFIRTL